MDEPMATRPAVQLAAAIRARELSSRELLELYLDRIERLDREVHAVVTFDTERARAAADAADARQARGDAARTAPRSSDHDQGRDRDGRHPIDGWRARAGRPRSRRGCARGRASQGGRRDRVRQDQPAAVVERLPDVQRHLRSHPQPLEPRPSRWADRRAGPRPRSRPASPASSWAPTSAVRCVAHRTAAACSD